MRTSPEKRNPSGSEKKCSWFTKLRQNLGRFALAGVIASGPLAACSAPGGGEQFTPPSTTASTESTLSSDKASAGSEASATDKSPSSKESQESKVYGKPDYRPDYVDVLQGWYAKDEATIREIGRGNSDDVLLQRAQFTAALYLEGSNNDNYPAFINNSLNLDAIGMEYNINNPLFGIDPLTANDNQLNAMLGAQELFPFVKVLESYHNGDDLKKIEAINSTTLQLLMGVTNTFPNTNTLGFEWANSNSIWQDPNEEPTRPETRTVRISDEDVTAIGILEKAYKPPASEKYPTFWVKTIRVDNPDIALIRAVTVVDLSDEAGQIPDFNGNYYAYEEGEPIDMGHPRQEVKIPVVRVDYIVKHDDLPDNLK